jgi:hypothetical protein
LLSIALLILSPHRAAADYISVYSDDSGSSCLLGSAGFTSTATVIHSFSLGATGSRFRLELPAGSSFFAFTPSPWRSFTLTGSILSGASITYGECLTGANPLGTITAILTQGTLCVRPADGSLNIMVSDCAFVETAATGGAAYVASNGPCYEAWQGIVATDQKTWGAVKSLYRE